MPCPASSRSRIALAAPVPLVPAALKGTDRLSRFAKLKVAYGEPVPVDDLEGMHEAPLQIHQRKFKQRDELIAIRATYTQKLKALKETA